VISQFQPLSAFAASSPARSVWEATAPGGKTAMNTMDKDN